MCVWTLRALVTLAVALRVVAFLLNSCSQARVRLDMHTPVCAVGLAADTHIVTPSLATRLDAYVDSCTKHVNPPIFSDTGITYSSSINACVCKPPQSAQIHGGKVGGDGPKVVDAC